MPILHELATMTAAELDRFLEGHGKLVAQQPRNAVPGIGSLPMPPATLGAAVSYTNTAGGSSSATGFQRSVVLGVYQAVGDDLEVLDWWLAPYHLSDIPNGRRYLTPALDIVGDDGATAPPATLDVTVTGDEVLLVRSVGLDDSTQQEIRDAVVPTPPDEWSQILTAHGPPPPTAAAALLESSDGAWRVTRHDNGAAADQLCFETNDAATSTCLIVDANPPAENLIIASQVAGDTASERHVFGRVTGNVDRVAIHYGERAETAVVGETTPLRAFVAPLATAAHGELTVDARAGSTQDTTKLMLGH